MKALFVEFPEELGVCVLVTLPTIALRLTSQHSSKPKESISIGFLLPFLSILWELSTEMQKILRLGLYDTGLLP